MKTKIMVKKTSIQHCLHYEQVSPVTAKKRGVTGLGNKNIHVLFFLTFESFLSVVTNVSVVAAFFFLALFRGFGLLISNCHLVTLSAATAGWWVDSMSPCAVCVTQG